MFFFLQCQLQKAITCAFFVTKCSDRSVLFIENSVCMATCRRFPHSSSDRHEASLYSTCFQTQQRRYEMVIESVSFSRLFLLSFNEGWTTVAWTGWTTWHACTWTLHASSRHTSYSHRMSSKSNTVCRWCPDLITRSVIVLPATEGATVSLLDVASFLFLCCLFHDDDVKDRSLWISINWFVTWQK